MSKDIHSKPFNDGTLIKLEIFREYLKSWLPTFIKDKKHQWKEMRVIDFFAGEGKDIVNNYGSPLIILDELAVYSDEIYEKSIDLKLLFNEFNSRKLEILKSNVKNFPNNGFEIIYKNKDFKQLFEEVYPVLKKNENVPRLIFLDQYGIKQITEDVFKRLAALKRTDFIFFISSSFVRRFSELPEFKKYLEVSKQDFIESKPFHSHRVVFNYYKSLLNDDYFLAPFSIKKGTNIYGLIFGSNHTLGIEKFLNICWKINPTTGDANYNIDEERIAEGEVSLFEEFNIPKKLSVFENMLKNLILDQNIITNYQAYKFTLDFGCLPKHCSTILNSLARENKIKKISTLNQKIHKLTKEKIELIL